MTVEAIVLAAGTSSRMGQPKLLLQLGGRSLVRQAVERARDAVSVDRVVVVVGAYREEIERELHNLPVQIVFNPEFASGQATSVRAGLAAVSPRAEAVVILLADQPYQRSEILERLIAAYRGSGAPIVAPRYGEQRGNPVLFDRRLFAELAALEGDVGARDVLRRRSSEVQSVEFDAAWLHDDVDTPADFERARSRLASSDV
ncbi:MAG: nucleotidyltransferase family protein [Chloroflexi bacterium]|nr:nucleotidyltransferase family protein [Chloroflexota bacterium]